MKKFGKFLLIVIVIGGVIWAALTFLLPSGFGSESEVVQSFFDNISSEDACEVHFNTETTSLCETFIDGLDGTTYTVDSTIKLGSNIVVTISIGATSETFTFTFIEEDTAGIIPFLNSKSYKIDTIE